MKPRFPKAASIVSKHAQNDIGGQSAKASTSGKLHLICRYRSFSLRAGSAVWTDDNAQPNSYRNSNQDSHTNTNANLHRYANRYSLSNTYAFPHTIMHD
jgi:hypothetical protein